MSIILIDGPDGTGKTGYAQWLADEVGYTFLRLEPDSNFGELDGETIEKMSAVFNYTLLQLDEQDVDIIVDRGPVSSIVYSRVFDRGKPDHAWNVLSAIDPYIVYLRCDRKELEIRYDDEKFSNVGEIADEYDEVMEKLAGMGRNIKTVDTSCGAPSILSDLAHRWCFDGVESEVKPADD